MRCQRLSLLLGFGKQRRPERDRSAAVEEIDAQANAAQFEQRQETQRQWQQKRKKSSARKRAAENYRPDRHAGHPCACRQREARGLLHRRCRCARHRDRFLVGNYRPHGQRRVPADGARVQRSRRLAASVPSGRTHAQVTLVQRAMDSMGIDYMVVFPTPMLVLGMHPQVETEVVIGNAFNKWLTEEILPQDTRLKAMLYLPFNHPEACVKAVEMYADNPGIIGYSVTSTRFRAVNHDSYMPLYSAIQASGKPLGFHSGFHWGDQSMQQCNRFISMHSISFVYYNLIHLTNWIINGLPERFPKLKVLWIESGLAWVPFLMQRLDSEYMMRSSEA